VKREIPTGRTKMSKKEMVEVGRSAGDKVGRLGGEKDNQVFTIWELSNKEV
jgi:hypothetical protein